MSVQTWQALFGAGWLLTGKVTLVLSAGWLGARLLRRSTAAARHAVWALAVACVLALPLFGAFVPAWRVVLPLQIGVQQPLHHLPVQPLRSEADLATNVAAGAARVVRPSSPVSPAAAPAHAAPSSVLGRTATMPSALVSLTGLLWLSGALVLLALAAFGRLQLRLLARRAGPPRAAALVELARRISRELGIGRSVRLLEGDARTMPMTFGILQPTLLLPCTAQSWPAAKLDAVLRHELAHVRRHDALTQLGTEICCALYWFHPLVWLAARRLRREREHACDDAVLIAGARATDYAAELLAIATTMRASPGHARAALAMARPTRLRARIVAVLDERARAERISARKLAAACAGACAIIVLLAALTPAAEARAASAALPYGAARAAFDAAAPPAALPSVSTSAGTAPRRAITADAQAAEALAGSPPSAVPSVPRSLIAAPAVALPRECFTHYGDGSVTGTIITRSTDAGELIVGGHARDGERIVQTRLDGVSLCMRHAGAVVFDAAGTRIESLGPDAWLLLEASGPRGEQRLEIIPGANGPQHTWYVAGEARPFDDVAREWRDAMIAVLTTHHEIAMLRGQEAGLRGRIAGVRGREAGLRGEIASVRGREASMRGEIASLRGREASRRGEIASTRARIASLENARRVTGDAETRARLDAEIDALRASVREADARANDPELEARIREIEQRIGEYGTAVRVAEVERRIAALDTAGEIAAFERQIEALDAERRVGGLEQRLAPRQQRLRAVLERIR